MSGGKKIVAVVDDDEALLEATVGFLEASGYEAHPFSSAENFLSSASLQSAHVLLTDVDMPIMSGMQLAEIVSVKNPRMRIIMMTALRDTSLRARGLAVGASEVLQKPILGHILMQCLDGT